MFIIDFQNIIFIFSDLCLQKRFSMKNAYAAIVINGVHFEKAKVPKNSPKICQN